MPSKSEAFDELRAVLLKSGLKSFLENIRVLTVLLDARGAVLGWNPAFDFIRESLPGATALQEFLSPSARAEFEQYLQLVLRTREPAHMHLELGWLSHRWGYDCALISLQDDRVLLIGEPGQMAAHTHEPMQAATEELDELKADLQDTKLALEVKQKELQAVLAQTDEVVHTDALTLLPNRRWIIADLQRQVADSERYGIPLSVSMIDLDGFKDVNDTYGHAVGDQVLRFIASELRDCIRGPDEIGRYGGDEFLVILPHTTVSAASEQASRLCQQVRSTPINAGKNEIRITLSIGLAQYEAHSDDWRTLLERADQALYQAKHNGRSQWAILNG